MNRVRSAPQPSCNEDYSAKNHRYTQPLPHMEPRCLREGDQLMIRFSHKLDKEAQDAITEDKAARQHSRMPTGIGELV
jgi:hypothetical protein